MNVQHWLEDDEPREPWRVYESMLCKACMRLHFINRVTGKLLGEEGR